MDVLKRGRDSTSMIYMLLANLQCIMGDQIDFGEIKKSIYK